MAKKNPHRRKKQHTTKSPKKVLKTQVSEPAQEQVIEIQNERSWSIMLIMAFVIFAVLGLVLVLLNNKNNPPNAIPIEAVTNTTSGGITIEGDGNLGQISNSATAGIQSNANPLGGSTTPANQSSGQSSQLQPTGDKCAYQQFNQSLSNACVSQ
jgi:hypothetical protein